ncbi:MAG: DUF3417 domain-containing protein [Planctomycetaceae bacterium]
MAIQNKTLFDKLSEISRNLWWSWQPEVVQVFRELNAPLFSELAHNPVRLLSTLGREEVERLAVEAGRVAPSRIGSAGEVGSGYGLLLASDYLREMGGALSFEARQGGGLTVRVTLPAA